MNDLVVDVDGDDKQNHRYGLMRQGYPDGNAEQNGENAQGAASSKGFLPSSAMRTYFTARAS